MLAATSPTTLSSPRNPRARRPRARSSPGKGLLVAAAEAAAAAAEVVGAVVPAVAAIAGCRARGPPLAPEKSNRVNTGAVLARSGVEADHKPRGTAAQDAQLARPGSAMRSSRMYAASALLSSSSRLTTRYPVGALAHQKEQAISSRKPSLGNTHPFVGMFSTKSSNVCQQMHFTSASCLAFTSQPDVYIPKLFVNELMSGHLITTYQLLISQDKSVRPFPGCCFPMT